MGYYRIPAAGRYRVVYRVREDALIVEVVCLGIRKEGSREDVYQVASKTLSDSENA